MNLNDFLKTICDNDTLKKYYAKKKCWQCRGTGEYIVQPPHGQIQKILCHCVKKNARKEWNEIESANKGQNS